MNFNEKFYEKLSSTNDFSLENLSDFADRTIIYADVQTKGHGRFDREWVSENSGNLYASIVLKPEVLFDENCVLSNLTQYLCVKLAETLEEYGMHSSIKWPNDVLVNGKKIAGILAQVHVSGAEFSGMVLGIGVNLNMTQEEIGMINQPATSVNLELQKTIDKREFAKKLFEAFFTEYDEFLNSGFALIKKRYCQRCDFISKEILIKNFDESRKGIAEKINDDGSLEMTFENGSETVRIGDLLWNC